MIKSLSYLPEGVYFFLRFLFIKGEKNVARPHPYIRVSIMAVIFWNTRNSASFICFIHPIPVVL